VIFGTIWAILVVGATVVGWFVLLLAGTVGSIGVHDGANRTPQLLLYVEPFVGLGFLLGGWRLISWLCYPKP
jgi:hypothetical protein